MPRDNPWASRPGPACLGTPGGAQPLPDTKWQAVFLKLNSEGLVPLPPNTLYLYFIHKYKIAFLPKHLLPSMVLNHPFRKQWVFF